MLASDQVIALHIHSCCYVYICVCIYVCACIHTLCTYVLQVPWGTKCILEANLQGVQNVDEELAAMITLDSL